MVDGYVLEQPWDERTESFVCYPKFRSEHGSYVSFKRGIWDDESQTYDADRLKVINMPVLKPHSGYGVTACVKHYMGVTSDWVTSRNGARAHSSIARGGMATVMSGARFPDLNILDAIWVSFRPSGGPRVLDGYTSYTGVVAASQDPVALDSWAAREILMQGALLSGFETESFDPDAGAGEDFSRYLSASARILQEDGLPATMNEAAMNVFVSR